MNKEQKQEVIEALKGKFSQYSNFYITDTENLSVAQITKLRRHCFEKQVEMKVAKNTLIKKALESLDSERYSGVYDSLHKVTALMFSESPKDPAVIISSFRKEQNGEKPLLKAAFLNGDIFVGNDQLVRLTKIKTKNELIGEVIGLLMSPIQRVIGALQNRPETSEAKTEAVPEAKAETQVKIEATPEAKAKEEAEVKLPTEVKTETKPEVEVKPEAAPDVDATLETIEATPKAKPASPKAEAAPETTEVKTEVASEAREATPKAEVVPETKSEAVAPAANEDPQAPEESKEVK
ncbi:MAG: 50S ribosomal protein L10 [Ginsengibacter sp.]